MTKNFKILGVLATILCLSLSVSAITSRNVVVKQNAQTLKSRSEAKGYFKHRGVTTFRGNDATKQNKIAPIAPSPNRAPAATTGKMPNLIGSVVQSEAGLAVGIYSIIMTAKAVSCTTPLVPTRKLHFTQSTSTMNTQCLKSATCKAKYAVCTSLHRSPKTTLLLPLPT